MAAQQEPDPRGCGDRVKATNALLSFAKYAEGQRAFRRAAEAYARILDRYDADCRAARLALGHRLDGDRWLAPPGGTEPPRDEADAKHLQFVEQRWRQTASQLAALHRGHARALSATGDQEERRRAWHDVLEYAPDDREGHEALGHESVDGFYGDAQQVAFVRRMRQIRAEAARLCDVTYPTEVLAPELVPEELGVAGLRFCGAKSKHFTHWVVGSADDAIQTLQWAERCHELLRFLLGDEAGMIRERAIRWRGIVRTKADWHLLLRRSPAIRDGESLERAKLFGGSVFATANGRATAGWCDLEHDADAAVAHVTKRWLCAGRNSAFGEGLVHATTFLLCRTTWSWFAQLPATASGAAEPMPHEPAVWQRAMQAWIEDGTDWPLGQVARERSDNFRDEARVKAWTTMSFVLARYPDSWHRLLEIRTDTPPEQVDGMIEGALGEPVDAVERGVRDWARAGSRIGRASKWQ